MHRTIALCLSLFAMAASAATEIAPRIHLIRGNFVPGSQPDGNTVIFTERDGLIVVDTGRHVTHTQQIIDFGKQAKKPVKAIINTHWHLDHIGGNLLLRREYPNVRALISMHIARRSTTYSSAKKNRPASTAGSQTSATLCPRPIASSHGR
ncbi:MAG TPA: MBL fold metallo-hydrolase [Thermoanaerobaculia bacterium]|nr:MBL fold metallo-hydrolase [Thermoanaerobaculia bacterium]